MSDEQVSNDMKQVCECCTRSIDGGNVSKLVTDRVRCEAVLSTNSGRGGFQPLCRSLHASYYVAAHSMRMVSKVDMLSKLLA